MKRKLVMGFCAGFTALTLFPQTVAASPELEAKVQLLEQQLVELKSMIEAEKAERQAVDERVVKASSSAAKDARFKFGDNSTFSYGGFIKVNGMYDDYKDGATPSAAIAQRILVPSLIPVGDAAASEGAHFNSDVTQSRFFFKTSTQTDAGQIDSHIELDFLSGGGDERISNSTNPRIRHGYFNWKYADDASLLVGQTWSTFFNVGALPQDVEFIGPTSGTVFDRQAQIRWTKNLAGGGSFMLAAENPSTSLAEAGSGVNGSDFDDNSIPDVILRYNGKSGNHSYSLAGIVREIAYDDGFTNIDDTGFAANFSGKYVLDGGHEFKYSLATGNLGRYIALNAYRDGGIDANGNLDLTSVTGGYVAYRHRLSDTWHAGVQYAYSKADLANGVSSANTESLSNLNLSLMYMPTAKLTIGGALIQAKRELENGIDGELIRLQLTTKYAF